MEKHNAKDIEAISNLIRMSNQRLEALQRLENELFDVDPVRQEHQPSPIVMSSEWSDEQFIMDLDRVTLDDQLNVTDPIEDVADTNLKQKTCGVIETAAWNFSMKVDASAKEFDELMRLVQPTSEGEETDMPREEIQHFKDLMAGKRIYVFRHLVLKAQVKKANEEAKAAEASQLRRRRTHSL